MKKGIKPVKVAKYKLLQGKLRLSPAGETLYNTPQNHPVEDDRRDIYPSTPTVKGCSERLTSLVLPGYTNT